MKSTDRTHDQQTEDILSTQAKAGMGTLKAWRMCPMHILKEPAGIDDDEHSPMAGPL